jgi:hypothetical protein
MAESTDQYHAMATQTSASRSPSADSSTLSEVNEPRVVWAPEGLWITEPPYTLPPGMDRCPVPTCSNKTIFKPYWRVNEHMKLKHGWPRKQTQRNLDKRISNTFRKDHKARSLALSAEPSLDDSECLTNRAHHDNDGDVVMLNDEDENENEEGVDDVTTISRPRRSGAKKDYSKLFDPFANPPPTAKRSLTIKLKVRAPDSALATGRKHRLSDADCNAMLHDTPHDTPKKNPSPPVHDTIDHIAIHEAQSYLFDLEQGMLPPLPYSRAFTSEHTTLAPKELMQGLRTFLANPRINTIIEPELARTILPVYHALVNRAESFIAANTAAMAAAPITSLASIHDHRPASTSPSSARVSTKARDALNSRFGEPATFTFSGPRERPWNWENGKIREYERERKRQDENSRKMRMETEKKDAERRPQIETDRHIPKKERDIDMESSLSSPLSSAESSPSSPRSVDIGRTPSTKTTPGVKTGIKLRLKMTPKIITAESSNAGDSSAGDEVVMLSSTQYFAARRGLADEQ